MARLHLAIVAGCLLLLAPCAGSYGLWDPWETHYAEVAREISTSGDWVSLTWDGTPTEHDFWSKPPLTFWAQAAGMAALRVDPRDADGLAGGTRLEWGVRLPGVLFAALAVWSVFFAAARLLGRRAGIAAAVVAATSPMFALIARQAMTDIYLAGTLTGALCLAAVALLDEDGPPRGLRWVAAGALVACVAPQLVGLAARAGTAAAIPYAVVAGALLVRIARVRTRNQALLHLAFVLAGLSVLAKGIVGVGIAAATLAVFLAITRDWRGFVRVRPLDGLATIAVVALPWHHAMYAVHGGDFLRELLLYNQFSRFGAGVHGERSGALGYFARQLGYGMLPWLPLVAGGLVAALRPPAGRAGKLVLLALVWALVAHGVVAASATKFHHYILPAIPPLAILAGWCADLLARRAAPSGVRAAALALGVPVMLLALAELVASAHAPERLFWLFDYDYVMGGLPWPDGLELRPIIAIAVVIAAVASVALVAGVRRADAVLAASAVLLCIYLVDVAMPRASDSWSQKEVIATYRRVRGPHDPLFAHWLYARGETLYTAGALWDPARPRERALATMFERGLLDYRARHPATTTYVLAWTWELDHLRARIPTARVVETPNQHVALVALPP